MHSTNSPDTPEIEVLRPCHAPDVARLHSDGIHTGFISSLGLPFLTTLYRALAESPASFGYVCALNSQLVGFISFAADLSSLYRTVVPRHCLAFLWTIGRHLCSARTARHIADTLLYPRKLTHLELPRAELLSISVDPLVRGRGVGAMLMRHGLQQCSARGLTAVKVLVAASNAPANALYLSSGFRLAARIDRHGVPSNIYVLRLGPPE
jgi:ribosomal protein S18 acetylase RimI-like enzyme